MRAAVAPVQAIVYQATNRLNGHRYIGVTIQGLAARESEHRKLARRPTGGFHFHRAMRKHGEENFVFELLGDFGPDEELARIYEREAIEAYKPEYNLSHGGEGGSMPEVTRQRISASNKGRVSPMKGKKFTDEHRAKISKANKGQPKPTLRGVPFTAERRAKISAAATDRVTGFYGKKMPREAIERAQATRKTRVYAKQPKGQNGKYPGCSYKRAVVCVTDGNRFESVIAASRFYEIYQASLRDVLKRRRDAVRGLVFRYEDDME